MITASLPPKKRQELELLQNFVRVSGIPLTVVEPDREAPDFIVELDGRRIGVEVTELFVPGPEGTMDPRARTSIGTRLANDARQRYTELGGKPIHVSIGLTPHDSLRDIRRDQAAEQLAQFVLQRNPKEGEVVSWHRGYPDKHMPSEIIYLNMLAVKSWGMAVWHASEAGWVAPLDENFLQPTIDEKATKLPAYQLVVPENWLLLATRGNTASQFFEVTKDFRPELVNSPFSRTYLFTAFEGRAIRLGASHAA